MELLSGAPLSECAARLVFAPSALLRVVTRLPSDDGQPFQRTEHVLSNERLRGCPVRALL